MEYIHVVVHYLINNYVQVYYDQYDIWSRPPIPCGFDHMNNESSQLLNLFRAIYYSYDGHNCSV